MRNAISLNLLHSPCLLFCGWVWWFLLFFFNFLVKTYWYSSTNVSYYILCLFSLYSNKLFCCPHFCLFVRCLYSKYCCRYVFYSLSQIILNTYTKILPLLVYSIHFSKGLLSSSGPNNKTVVCVTLVFFGVNTSIFLWKATSPDPKNQVRMYRGV